MKPALCSSTSGEPVKPDLASRAASTPDCAVRPTCSDLVMVPKFATVPAASEAAIAIALRGLVPASSRLSRAQAAAAAQRSPDRGRMEAALVQRAGLELLQQRPDFVTCHIGCDRLARR